MKPALTVTNLFKTFKIPKEKLDSFQERILKFRFRSDYQTLKALSNLDLQVKKGEWLGIIGANGSGKSTLLKLMAGIYQANRGQIQIHGHLVPFLELGVGFNPELSARDNIYLNGVILGMSRKQIKARFNQIVNFAGIQSFVNQKIKNFSTGMEMRLGFSIAIQSPADIYLFDEILSVGDRQFQKKCQKIFNKMKQKNKTVILVSHNLDQVKDFCDRVVWLDKGQIKAKGNPEKIIKSYTA